MVESIRTTEQALGTVRYGANLQEKENMIFRRSLFVVKEMKANEKFSEENVRSIRPGSGLPPKYFQHVLGRQAKRNIPKGTPLSWELVGS